MCRKSEGDWCCFDGFHSFSCLLCCSRYVRNQVIFASTMFQAVCYLPDECQLITGGTDRKVGYWEVYDGSQIRELEGSKTGSINGIDISSCGRFFVTGGDDRVVKVPHCTGAAHTPISRVFPLSCEPLPCPCWPAGVAVQRGRGHSRRHWPQWQHHPCPHVP